MCFSAPADLVGGVILGAIGVDAAWHVRRRRDHLGIAALPMLLGLHQLDEAFVWWGLQGHVSASVGRVATWIYLVFAFVVLPVYLPLAVLALEPPGRRRRMMLVFVGLGAVVSAVLLAALVRGPVTVALGDHHLSYSIGLTASTAVVTAYVVATCGAAVFSGYRRLAVFGLVNLVAVAVLAHVTISGLPSLWCAWAAVTAGVVAWHLRSGDGHVSVARALA
jgi:hypothetical protein